MEGKKERLRQTLSMLKILRVKYSLIIYQSHSTDGQLGWGPVGEAPCSLVIQLVESGGWCPRCSIREVEVVVGVVIVLSLADEGTDHVDGEGEQSNSGPDLNAEVNHEALKEELVSTTVQEVEQPLLSGVGSVMPDVASHITLLVVEIVLTIPGSVLHLGNSETLTVHKAHVLSVSELVVSQTAS